MESKKENISFGASVYGKHFKRLDEIVAGCPQPYREALEIISQFLLLLMLKYHHKAQNYNR